MYIKGIRVRKSNAIYFRMAIEGDINLRGEQVESNYVSFVRIKDCPLVEKDGETYFDPNSPKVKCISVTHGGTFYAYGKTKLKWNQPITNVYTDGCVYVKDRWQETPFYAVKDAQVYVGHIKKLVTDKQINERKTKLRIKKLNKLV